MKMKETRDDPLERSMKSRKIEGMKTRNHDRGQLDSRLMDVIRKI